MIENALVEIRLLALNEPLRARTRANIRLRQMATSEHPLAIDDALQSEAGRDVFLENGVAQLLLPTGESLLANGLTDPYLQLTLNDARLKAVPFLVPPALPDGAAHSISVLLAESLPDENEPAPPPLAVRLSGIDASIAALQLGGVDPAALEELVADMVSTMVQTGNGLAKTIDPATGVITLTNTAPLTEQSVEDITAAFLDAGVGVDIVLDNETGNLVITAPGDGVGLSEAQVRDIITTALTAGTNVAFSVDPGTNVVTISATGGGAAVAAATTDAAGIVKISPAPADPANPVAAGVNHTHAVMVGATTTTAGTAGFVPAPASGDVARYFAADGTFKTLTTSNFRLPRYYEHGGWYDARSRGVSGSLSNTTLRYLGYNNLLHLAPVWIEEAVQISELSCYLAAAGATGDVFRLGIYAPRSNDWRPGALIVDAGTVDASSVAYKTKIVSPVVAVSPPLIWLAVQGGLAADGAAVMGINIPFPAIGKRGAKLSDTHNSMSIYNHGIGLFMTNRPLGSTLPADLSATADGDFFCEENSTPLVAFRAQVG